MSTRSAARSISTSIRRPPLLPDLSAPPRWTPPPGGPGALAAAPGERGRPLDLYEHPATAFVAGFIGSPAMNLVAGRIDGHGVTIGDTMLPLNAPDGVGNRPVLVGLRPEHLDLAPDGPIALKVELLER